MKLFKSRLTGAPFKIDSDNFCALPFGHTTVTTNGDFLVCCLHHVPAKDAVNINTAGFDRWNQSKYLNEVRNSFEKNQRHPGCISCWRKEDAGEPSMRTRTQQEYRILGITKKSTTPVNVEVQLGNLCNLKCLMCNDHQSSAILAENIQLGINRFDQRDFSWNETGFQNLRALVDSGTRVLNIRGGEPFYNKPLLDLIENLPEEKCARIMLHITTNATQWNDRWANAIKKFKLVRLMYSIDAVGDLYEYMRYPATWSVTESNVEQMSQLSNVRSMIHCVVQNLNCMSLRPLIEWAQEKNIYLQLEQLHHPSWLAMTNLPNTLKQQAINELETILSRDLENYLKIFLEMSRSQLVNSFAKPNDTELWNLFQSQIGLRDQHRNNSHRRFLNY
jgi:MoaA/NifB/PqqE/SkfB family radical SAM enzyme